MVACTLSSLKLLHKSVASVCIVSSSLTIVNAFWTLPNNELALKKKTLNERNQADTIFNVHFPKKFVKIPQDKLLKVTNKLIDSLEA